MTRPVEERALLREVRSWMGATANKLAALLPESRALRHRLERTKTYRRVIGKEDAEDEATYDLAGTLGVMFEDDIDTMLWYLRAYARGRQPGPPRQGRKRATGGVPAPVAEGAGATSGGPAEQARA